jgi:hypothetical protein
VGKASSAKKARSRAALDPTRRNRLPVAWIVVGVLVIALGVAVVVASRSKSDPSPHVGDHWHAAIGVNVCGQWADVAGTSSSAESKSSVSHSPTEFTTQFSNTTLYAGVHTHHDGVIHVEPKTSVDTGNHVTVGRWFNYGGWKLDGSGFDLSTGYPWPLPSGMKAAYHNGDKCPDGKVGKLVWSVRHFGDTSAKTMTGNPADYKLRDLDVIAIGFLAAGQKLGTPPSGAAFIPTPTSSAAPSPTTTTGSTTTPSTTAAAPTSKP